MGFILAIFGTILIWGLIIYLPVYALSLLPPYLGNTIFFVLLSVLIFIKREPIIGRIKEVKKNFPPLGKLLPALLFELPKAIIAGIGMILMIPLMIFASIPKTSFTILSLFLLYYFLL